MGLAKAARPTGTPTKNGGTSSKPHLTASRTRQQNKRASLIRYDIAVPPPPPRPHQRVSQVISGSHQQKHAELLLPRRRCRPRRASRPHYGVRVGPDGGVAAAGRCGAGTGSRVRAACPRTRRARLLFLVLLGGGGLLQARRGVRAEGLCAVKKMKGEKKKKVKLSGI